MRELRASATGSSAQVVSPSTPLVKKSMASPLTKAISSSLGVPWVMGRLRIITGRKITTTYCDRFSSPPRTIWMARSTRYVKM